MSNQFVMDFLSIQGYGIYVWPCIAMTVVVLAVEIFWLRKRYRRFYEKTIRSEFDHDPAS